MLLIPQSKEDPNWSDQRVALKELYAPRPTFLALLPPFSQEQSLSNKSQAIVAVEGEAPEDKTPSEVKEMRKTLSSSLLHLVVLQVSSPLTLLCCAILYVLCSWLKIEVV